MLNNRNECNKLLWRILIYVSIFDCTHVYNLSVAIICKSLIHNSLSFLTMVNGNVFPVTIVSTAKK